MKNKLSVKFFFIGIGFISLYLILILSSFSSSDPGWLQDVWHESVHNIGGVFGARIADFLFFLFGSSAYLIPLFFLLYFWCCFFLINDCFISIVFFKLIGMIILLSIFCCLEYLIFDDVFYFTAGGIVGYVLSNLILNNQYDRWITCFLLLLIGIVGNIFLFNYSVIKKVKNIILHSISFLFSVFFVEKTFYISKNQHYSVSSISDRYSIIFSLQKNGYLKILKEKIHSFKEKFHGLISKYDQIDNQNKLLNLNKEAKECNGILHQKKDILNDLVDQSLYKQTILMRNTNEDLKNRKINFMSFRNYNIDDSKILERRRNSNNIKNIVLPDVNLLQVSCITKNKLNCVELKKKSQLLESKLSEYHVTANVVNVIPGPVITRFELNLSAGVRSAKISSLSRDLARSLSVESVRVIEVIPGTAHVGLEIPNKKRDLVYLKDVINSDKFQKINTPLALALGQNVSGQPMVEDLRYMPHLLVSGTTGSGKSIGINTMIVSILYKATPENVRFIMIDPKILELSIYSDIPHLYDKIITETQDVIRILTWCVEEMEYRYKLMARLEGVRNLDDYNRCVEQFIFNRKNANDFFTHKYDYKNERFTSANMLKKLPYIVIVIDEFSDLIITTAKQVETLIVRLTQKARAAGIHVILATQRPSVDVITGLIKANIPSRIAFTVSSKIDSRTILGQSGAESLLGMGDMLYLSANSYSPVRIHGAFIQNEQINAIIKFWKNQFK